MVWYVIHYNYNLAVYIIFYNIKELHKLYPDCTPLGLIEKSLSTKEVSEIG